MMLSFSPDTGHEVSQQASRTSQERDILVTPKWGHRDDILKPNDHFPAEYSSSYPARMETDLG
ncbi:TPA: hypothetical protein EYM26_03395 [Candidatus Poribacteria bacterium]|nr:hypothetical protein [Candidatus Poribacteria bacterium]